MKAMRCHEFGPPETLQLDEVKPLINPPKGSVVVSVEAAGVNFPDTLIVQGKYQFQPDMPFSPGGEVSGVIKEVGEGVQGLKVGDRVLAGTGWGGFAEEVIAPASNTFKIPDAITYEQAAVVAEAYGTSYHALVDRAQIQSGETLMVLGGAGGVGIAAVQIGKALGAKVIAVASSNEKLDFCREHGADLAINYSEENLKERAKELTGGKGVDVIYDPVGAPFTESALRAIAWKGRHLIVGFAAGEIPKIPMNLPLLKGCSIVGVFWGGFFRQEPSANRENFMKILSLIESGKIDPPIQEVYALKDASRALRHIMDRKVLGKVVLKIHNA